MKSKALTKILAVLILAFALTGCGSTASQEEASNAESKAEASPEAESHEEEEAEGKEEATQSPEEEKEEELEEEPEEEPVYVEDTNEYGNTIGNSYNDGTIVYDEDNDCLYFYNIYERIVVKTDVETGHTVPIIDLLVSSLNLYEGKLYGTEIDEELNPKNLLAYDLQTGALETVRETPASYFQLVDGELYFTDEQDHTLRMMEADGEEEEILVEEPVYFPVVYKDIIVFQLDSDKESLYSIPRYGGDMVKLNDMRSYSPIIYHDKIYYNGIDDDEKATLRCMNLDGSEDEVLLDEQVLNMNLSDGKLYFVEEDTPNKISYIDLTDENGEIQELNLGEPIRKALKEAYGAQGMQIMQLSPFQFAGDFVLAVCIARTNGTDYTDEYLYRMDTDELFIIPIYCADKGSGATSEAKADTQAPAAGDAGTQQKEQPQAAPEVSDKDAQARAVAQSIADSIPAGSDLERVRAAAAAVAGYCANATYTSSDPDYRTAYGVFCKGVYTCAGSTRALGLVLDCMGYSWTHENANQWTHQWCELTMDGQAGWADGMGGIADYGACPFASGGSYTTSDGRTYFVP